MFGSLLSRAELAGVGIVLKVGADGGLYVKSMQKKGPAWGSNIVQVLLRDASYPCLCSKAGPLTRVSLRK